MVSDATQKVQSQGGELAQQIWPGLLHKAYRPFLFCRTGILCLIGNLKKNGEVVPAVKI
jgi:hypothetical protein